MSTGLLYLSSKEFSIKQDDKGDNLINKISKGISMVLFYSRSCKFCQTLIPHFKSLPSKVQGIHFAMANVSADNKRLEKMAAATLTPIRYVPYIVFYVNGEFFIEYRGPKTVEAMAKAAYEVSTKVLTGKDFVTGKICSKNNTLGYCAGENDWEDDVCSYDEAYSGKQVLTKSSKCMSYGECY